MFKVGHFVVMRARTSGVLRKEKKKKLLYLINQTTNSFRSANALFTGYIAINVQNAGTWLNNLIKV